MVLSDSIHVMLLTHAEWAAFTNKPIVDAKVSSEVSLALGVDDRQAVDALVEAARANGGRAGVNPAQELPFMYSRSIEDLDGHLWEPLFFDMSKMPQA